MNKETYKGIIIGVISSLIASGCIYFLTSKWIWNYNIPIWIWLSISLAVYLFSKLIRCLKFKHNLKCILSEYKEGVMGDSYPYTWEYRKSKGTYSVYGYEPYNIRIKDNTKESLSAPNTIVCSGHYVSENELKQYIQLQIVFAMNKNIQPFIKKTILYMDYIQDSRKHKLI